VVRQSDRAELRAEFEKALNALGLEIEPSITIERQATPPDARSTRSCARAAASRCASIARVSNALAKRQLYRNATGLPWAPNGKTDAGLTEREKICPSTEEVLQRNLLEVTQVRVQERYRAAHSAERQKTH